MRRAQGLAVTPIQQDLAQAQNPKPAGKKLAGLKDQRLTLHRACRASTSPRVGHNLPHPLGAENERDAGPQYRLCYHCRRATPPQHGSGPDAFLWHQSPGQHSDPLMRSSCHCRCARLPIAESNRQGAPFLTLDSDSATSPKI